MRPTERGVHRQLESLEGKQSGDDGDDDDRPVSVMLGDGLIESLPDPEHGTGIRTFPSREAAEAELGEDFWYDPMIKIWDFLNDSDTPADNT